MKTHRVTRVSRSELLQLDGHRLTKRFYSLNSNVSSSKPMNNNLSRTTAFERSASFSNERSQIQSNSSKKRSRTSNMRIIRPQQPTFPIDGMNDRSKERKQVFGEVDNQAHKKKTIDQKSRKNTYQRTRRLCCILSSILLLLLLAILVTILIVAFVVKPIATKPTTSSTIRVSCKSLCGNAAQIPVDLDETIAKWSFENNFLDTKNNYHGIPSNNPSFNINGYAKHALSLNSTTNQFLTTPYIPLASRSFTFEAWVYPKGFPNSMHHSIFGLCPSQTNNQCLHLTIKKIGSIGKLYFGFFGNDCLGNNAVTIGTWNHVAFVFDLTNLQQYIYLNGKLDNQCVVTSSLTFSSGDAVIGDISGLYPTYGNNSFHGDLDEMIIVNRVRSACEILEDSSLSVCLNFDNGSELIDLSPYDLSARTSASYVPNGHSQQAVSFDGANSTFYQVGRITSLGVVDQAFSISLWIRPRSLTGVLVHVSSNEKGHGWCIPFLGFHFNGSLVAQTYINSPGFVPVPSAVGSKPTMSMMSHVVSTWSPINGIRLYLNNVLVGSNLNATPFYTASGMPNYVTLANALDGVFCVSNGIPTSSIFNGDMDDFRIYNRELTVTEINTLYNL